MIEQGTGLQMPFDDPSAWASAIKATLESAKTAWDLIKEYRSGKGGKQKQEQIEKQTPQVFALARTRNLAVQMMQGRMTAMAIFLCGSWAGRSADQATAHRAETR